MKLITLLLILMSFMLSCSSIPPEKKFITRTFITEYVIECLYYRISETEYKKTCPGDDDYPPNPIVIDLGNLKDDKIGGLINEIDYQETLKKECKAWR